MKRITILAHGLLRDVQPYLAHGVANTIHVIEKYLEV